MRLSNILLSLLSLASCTAPSQSDEVQPNYRLVGGPCEGCEAVLEYGDRQPGSIDTLPGFQENEKALKISGTIYEQDGTTPAEGVILYLYQTNQEGLYQAAEGATGWARRHGSIRGWVKTDKNGQYTFYALKSGVYPNGSEPAHIHPTILEPNGKYYWLDSYFFAGDSLLAEEEINNEHPRGGSSGILTLMKNNGLWTGTRNFVLGKNIQPYD